MNCFDASAMLLVAERERLHLPPGDPLLRHLRPWAHLLDADRVGLGGDAARRHPVLGRDRPIPEIGSRKA